MDEAYEALSTPGDDEPEEQPDEPEDGADEAEEASLENREESA